MTFVVPILRLGLAFAILIGERMVAHVRPHSHHNRTPLAWREQLGHLMLVSVDSKCLWFAGLVAKLDCSSERFSGWDIPGVRFLESLKSEHCLE